MADMPWNQAIEKVLREQGEPMNYLDITEEIVRRGLRTNIGASPSYTVSAQFSMDKQKGDNSRFVWVSKGVYGLREWQQDGPPAQPAVQAPETPLAELDHLSMQAFAMYWEREKVDWSKSLPRLLGQQFQNAQAVDFAEQRGLYVLYDHRTTVYVGRATQQSLGSRLRDHTVDRLRSRWDRFSWFGFWGVSEAGSLIPAWNAKVDLDGLISQIEAALIEIIEPPQNRQQGKGLSAIEYLQSDDPAFGKKKKAELLAMLATKLVGEEG